MAAGIFRSFPMLRKTGDRNLLAGVPTKEIIVRFDDFTPVHLHTLDLAVRVCDSA